MPRAAGIASADLDLIQYVYSLDSDVHAKTDSDSTVMHATVMGTSFRATQDEICEIIQFLADKGADPDPMDDNGFTPIRISDILPIDKASALFYKLTLEQGRKVHIMPKDIAPTSE